MLPRKIVCGCRAQCRRNAAHAIEQQLDLLPVPVRAQPVLTHKLAEWLATRSGPGAHLLLLMDAVIDQRLRR